MTEPTPAQQAEAGRIARAFAAELGAAADRLPMHDVDRSILVFCVGVEMLKDSRKRFPEAAPNMLGPLRDAAALADEIGTAMLLGKGARV